MKSISPSLLAAALAGVAAGALAPATANGIVAMAMTVAGCAALAVVLA